MKQRSAFRPPSADRVGGDRRVAAEQPVRPEPQRSPGRLTGPPAPLGPPPRLPERYPRRRRRTRATGRARHPRSLPQVEILGRQLLQLAGEQRLVQGAELGQLVVGQAGKRGAAPRQVVRARSPAPRSARAARPRGCGRALHALAVARHQHRHGPAEPRHRARDLRELVRPVRLGVARIVASGARAANARCAPERSSGSWVGTLRAGWRRAGWIPGGGFRRWIPWAAVELLSSSGSHPRKGASL